jgi:hypothetical protein
MHGAKAQNGDGYILIQARSQEEVAGLAERIARTPGVVKVERVHGPYDVVAVTHRDGGGEPPSFPEQEIGRLDGVLRAIPLLVGPAAVSSMNGAAA